MSDATPEQARAALEWQAEEAAASRAVESKVAALNEPTPGPTLSPEDQAKAEQARQMEAAAAAALPMLCAFVWGLVDKLAVSQLGTEAALTPDEKETLAGLTVPVVDKYLGGSMEWVKTPEGALALAAGFIYAPKLLFAPKKAEPTPPPPEATA